jgi:anti-anti-sigma factor
VEVEMSDRSSPIVPSVRFGVQDSVCGGRHTLVLSGELDIAPATALDTMIRRLCTEETTGIALDLRRLTLIDSAGLKAIMLAKDRCESHGYEFFLIPGSAHIQQIFELTGVLDVLPFRAGDSAIAASDSASMERLTKGVDGSVPMSEP